MFFFRFSRCFQHDVVFFVYVDISNFYKHVMLFIYHSIYCIFKGDWKSCKELEHNLIGILTLTWVDVVKFTDTGLRLSILMMTIAVMLLITFQGDINSEPNPQSLPKKRRINYQHWIKIAIYANTNQHVNAASSSNHFLKII